MRKIYFRFLFKEDRRCSRNLGDHVPQRNSPNSLIYPAGSWPRRMPRNSLRPTAANAPSRTSQSVSGGRYPQPRVIEGRRRIWLRDDLDRVIAPDLVPGDIAEDL